MAQGQFYRLAHLTLKQFRALDRSRTVVLLPIGMIEEHGEHLPLGTDTFAVEELVLAASAWLLEHEPTLNILMLPTISYGTDPIDLRRPELFSEAGSVWIGRETLKSLVRDIVVHMVRYGFRYIFPMGFHGGPQHSLALAEVCEEIRGRYPGLVIAEPIGYVLAGAEEKISPSLATLLGRPLTTQEKVALRTSVHASMFETSMMLHLAPELVDPAYKTLHTIEAKAVYRMPGWPGYIGAGPRHAKAELGAALLHWRGVRAAALIRRAIAGEDLSQLPRHPTWYDDTVQDIPEETSEPPVHIEPHIDSRPAMYIPRSRIDEMAALEGDEADTMLHQRKTPPSSALETRPMRGRAAAEEDVPEDRPPSPK